MASKFNPPTRKKCKVCEELAKTAEAPIIDSHSGKASSANNFRFHNWYNFVLGYSPQFPEYMLASEKLDSTHFIIDPFMGTATTNVVCKSNCIKSLGIEANDYFINVGEAKLTWDLDLNKINLYTKDLLSQLKAKLDSVDFEENEETSSAQGVLFPEEIVTKKISYKTYLEKRPEELMAKYMCDRPFVKLQIIWELILDIIPKEEIKTFKFFKLAWSSIIVPSSNISYGPGFGVRKPKINVDVYKLFTQKVERMCDDLASVQNSKSIDVPFTIVHGDSRKMSEYLKDDSVDFMITSPPYPGDHEYTKHTKLELIMENHARTIKEFRVIKKRMLTGSTTNIYKEDNDRAHVEGNELIKEVTDLIQERLEEDNATSGFEKLYTKLVWEYFGGMSMVFQEALKVLKKGGGFSLLVSDSHAFKMVHIRTAFILKDIALKVGFSEGKIELWQNKKTTSHKYNLREEILTVYK